MKHIRIGVGSGGCAYERLEPAVDLIKHGNLDYLVFECLSERTIAEAMAEKLDNPEKGYNAMLEIRMRKMLRLAVENHVRIISNMGGANTPAAVRAIKQIAGEAGLKGLKIGMVLGDDITDRVNEFMDCSLCDSPGRLSDLKNILSANVYFGSDGIKEALDDGADLVITGRVVDPALFVGPICHEFGFTNDDPHRMGQAILLGHLLECCAQITGGYYVDPGLKDLPDLDRLGFPIAEMDETGDFIITKLEGTGGAVNTDICKEQLLYEIGDPACYVTPDGEADFTGVRFEELKKDVVKVTGAVIRGVPSAYKVNIGYSDCYAGTAEISYGGLNSLNRARVVADAIRKRWKLIGVEPLESRIDFIGYNSLYGEKIASLMSDGRCPEVRLRAAVRTATRDEALLLNHETQCLYINGAAGGAGITASVSRVISVNNIMIPRDSVDCRVRFEEVNE